MPNLSFGLQFGAVVVSVIHLALAVLWLIMFVDLMSVADDQFAGPYVRFGWIGAFVFLWMLAPLAFLFWRKGRGRGSSLARIRRGDRTQAD